MRRRPHLFALAAAVLLTGCTAADPLPDRSGDAAERAAAELAAGLAARDVSGVEFADATGAEVNAAFAALVAGLGPQRPAVTVASVSRDGRSATAALSFSWTFPGVPQAWTYQTQASLTEVDRRWRTDWESAIVQPELDGTNRLTARRLYPARGELLGEAGDPIVVERPVFRIGIDKAQLSAEESAASALRLARLLDIDERAYARQVAAAGSRAFVEALVLRRTADNLPRGAQIRAIPGALSIQDARMLAPTRDFARPVIGTVGEATKESVDASGGAVVAGDLVGLTGLQERYDQQLRGTPGIRVQLVAASRADPSASPSPASPAPAPTPTPSPSQYAGDRLRGGCAGRPGADDHPQRGAADPG